MNYALIEHVHEKQKAHARRLMAAADRAQELGVRSAKRASSATLFGSPSLDHFNRNLRNWQKTCDHASRRFALARRMRNIAADTLTGG